VPIKIFDLAKELKLSNSEIVAWLDREGFGKLTPSSDLDDVVAGQVRIKVAQTASAGESAVAEAIEIPENISVKDLGERLGVGAAEVQKVLMGFGVLAGLNQRLAPDAVTRIAKKLGKTVRTASTAPAPVAAPVAPPPPPAAPVGRPAVAPTPVVRPRTSAVATRGKSELVARPPVVTIMGHVDHGKTTLLDTIRKTSVTSGEAGGITQHIGAYQVERDGKRITFLDTPGHAAFSAMRARGASVTDIVVIVVAADDSIMPQTEEAIQIARDAHVPIIVAVNKIDVDGANPDRVLTDLTRYEIVPEAYGGDVPTVNISAKQGTGIDELLETILLVAEVVVDPKADPAGAVQGTIIEAKIDKGRGAVATVLVQQGTLRKGDVVVAGASFGRVRTMTDDRGGALAKAGPSTPVEIVGLGDVPEAGDRLEVAKDEKEGRAIAQRREVQLRDLRMEGGGKQTLEQLYRQLRTGPIKELNLVIKADVQGSVQAIRDSLEPLGNDEVRVRILQASVGPISESDVLLVSSDKEASEQNSLIIGFNVGTAGSVEKRAEKEHVQIRNFSIIYELIDAVKDAMLALLPPIYEEANLGKAEIRALFKLPGGRQIAGCYVTDGLIRRNAKVRVFRGRDLIHEGDIDTLKRFKDDAREVTTGYECGLTVRDHNDIAVGDVLECYELRQIQREL
jgi:translation initiation factor IF-2